jgi:hypothetical protein
MFDTLPLGLQAHNIPCKHIAHMDATAIDAQYTLCFQYGRPTKQPIQSFTDVQLFDRSADIARRHVTPDRSAADLTLLHSAHTFQHMVRLLCAMSFCQRPGTLSAPQQMGPSLKCRPELLPRVGTGKTCTPWHS